MTYFEDLSDYVYAPGFIRPGTKAVGWLAHCHSFPTVTPDEEVLDLLWLYCSISVVQSRGIHDCEFCPRRSARYFERNGQRLLLGLAEIRVFSPEGPIYAAPTLIYHYVAVHRYKPPDDFLRALREGPRPPSPEYFNALAKLNLQWNETFKGAPKNRIPLSPGTGPDNRHYLEQIGTLNAIERMDLKLEEGLIVHFCNSEYRLSAHSEENLDYLLFEGRVYFDAEKRKWYAVIDQKTYRYESDVHTPTS